MIGDPAMALQEELRPGEQLLWSGKPRPGLSFGNNLALIPFSLFWGGFAIFWESMAIRGWRAHPATWFMPIWGIPFVGIGLYLMVGRFFVEKAQRENTAYGVTHERILIRSGIFTKTTRSFALRNLPELSLQEKADGSGTLIMGSTPFPFPRAWLGTTRYQPPTFEMIPAAREVYNLIVNAQQAAK